MDIKTKTLRHSETVNHLLDFGFTQETPEDFVEQRRPFIYAYEETIRDIASFSNLAYRPNLARFDDFEVIGKSIDISGPITHYALVRKNGIVVPTPVKYTPTSLNSYSITRSNLFTAPAKTMEELFPQTPEIVRPTLKQTLAVGSARMRN